MKLEEKMDMLVTILCKGMREAGNFTESQEG